MRGGALVLGLCLLAFAVPAGAAEPGPAGPGEPGGPRIYGPAPESMREPGDRAFRLGVTNSFFFGFAGGLKNPVPAYAINVDFGFPTGRSMRYHVEVGHENANGYTGFRFNPLTLGYAIPILDEDYHLEAEVLLAVVQSEVLFNNGFAIALSSGLRGQIVFSYGLMFAAFAPIGFEIRYAYGLEKIGIRTGAGANWPLMLTVGLEL